MCCNNFKIVSLFKGHGIVLSFIYPKVNYFIKKRNNNILP